MLKSLSKDKTISSIRDYFQIIQIIYTCCLQELIRQISLDCKDRGLLLNKIWTSYLNMLENCIIEEANTQQQREKDYLEEITKVHKIYQQEIENNKEFVEYTKIENFKLAEIAKNYKENQKFLKRAYKHFEKNYKLIKMQLETTINEQKVLLDENNHLKKLLEGQIDEKNEKEIKLDKIFNKSEKISDFVQNKEFQFVSNKSPKNTRNKHKTTNEPKKSVLAQWKSLENKEKNIDTCDLIITWDACVNTNLVYGAKNRIFIPKSSQTMDRNQFLRESKLNQEDIDEIFEKESKKTKNIENIKNIEEITMEKLALQEEKEIIVTGKHFLIAIFLK